MRRLVTSESVTGGHPDKLCDQVSDGVLDALLASDSNSRVAIEAAAKDGTVWVFGEVASKGYADVSAIVRDVLTRNGYVDPAYGITAEGVGVLTSISRQSSDIAIGVDAADPLESGAGDQGLMIGYATDETSELMPLPLSLARLLTEALTQSRESKRIPWLRPDGKAQVSIAYESGEPIAITNVVISAQHHPEIKIDEVREALRNIAAQSLPNHLVNRETKYHLNPTGRFVLGGPAADSGLTGRKIIADTYGGAARHGGGAFSGKDPTKVDRTGAYAARWIARSIVAAKIARRVEVEIAYAIGVAEPTAVSVNTFGAVNDEMLTASIRERVDLRPGALIERLGLRLVKYSTSARFGHFGRSVSEQPWEGVIDL